MPRRSGALSGAVVLVSHLRRSDPPIAAAEPTRATGRVELTALLAMSMALAALGIDLMLPAFGVMRADLGLAENSNALTGLITAYFLGLATGQLVYGPLADRFGRRPVLFLGYGIYAAGAAAGAIAPSLGLILVARFVWGFGAAGPRVVTLAIVRDRWQGERMARAMSLILAGFIIVPVFAPTLGSVFITFGSWRVLFGACVLAAAVMTLWATRRLPETLVEDNRRSLQFRRVVVAARQVATHRQTVAYTLAMTALYGVFTSYLGSSEVIYSKVFDAHDLFPYLFGGLAAVMGVSMLVNARVVERIGTRRFAHGVLLAYLAGGALIAGIALATGGVPPLWLFMLAMGVMLATHALMLPNFNTIAMHPMGEIAGTASSVIGAVQLATGALLGAVLDRLYDGTILPLSLGFLVYGVIAVGLVLWGEGGRLFQPLDPPADDDAPAGSEERVPVRARR